MYLLDTSVLLWALAGEWGKLNKKIHAILVDEENLIFVSVVSVWEIIIKKSLGKLKVPDDLNEKITSNGFKWLKIELDHILELEKLPLLHNDSFDRLLIAQAIQSDVRLITTDQKIQQYSGNFFVK